MKKLIMPFVLCLASMGIMASCAKIEYNNTGSISGTVIVYSAGSTIGSPISNALVTLTPGQANTYTGTDGTFSYEDIEVGKYTITVQSPGYQANRKEIHVEAGKVSQVALTMEVAQ